MATAVITPTATAPSAAPVPAKRRRRGPWRHPWGLEGFTWLYLIWSIVPIGVAVLFSFNRGKSQSSFQGLSLRWYTGTSKAYGSVLHDPTLHAAVVQTLKLGLFVTLITIPLGVGFAIGIDRWRGRTSNGLNLVMIFSFVVPELLLAVALMFVFLQLLKFIHLGDGAETAALVVWNISWPAIIVRARLVTIGRVFEEAAADLGASRFSAMWRVLLPMLMPAIFASAVLTFASVIDDFVIVEQLSGPGSQTMSVLIYSQAHGGNNGPALNALATLMLLFSLVVAGLGYVAYRLMTKGERGNTAAALTSIAGM
ncbi:MAG: ABC transporter permease [Acidimicrobiales bacterium]|jgi:spermidine/putrescine transport system permease protein